MGNKKISGMLLNYNTRGIERVLDGEDVVDAISCTIGHDHNGKKQMEALCALVLTKSRIIMYHNKILGHTSIDFQLSKINNVVLNIGLIYADIQIHSADDIIKLKRADKKEGERFAKSLKNQISLLSSKS